MVWSLFPTDPTTGEEKYYIFGKGTYKVGRRGCDVIINKDKGVSRVHAELIFDAMVSLKAQQKKSSKILSRVKVKDCSKFGTFITSKFGTKEKVHELPNNEGTMKDGDVVSFGVGNASYRFCFVPLDFFVCSEPLQVNNLLQESISSIGAHVTTILSQECTHVLVEQNMPVSQSLVDAIVAKKPIISISWVEILAEKNIRSELPSCSQCVPLVRVEGESVNVADVKTREKCLEGYTFVLEPTTKYEFGDRFQSLIEAGGAKTVSLEELCSSSQDTEYGETDHLVCVISKSSANKVDYFNKITSLFRVNEMDLVCAIVSGTLAQSSLISAPVVVLSSCSTDETVVPDSDGEMETAVSVVAVDSEETPKDAHEDAKTEEMLVHLDTTEPEESGFMSFKKDSIAVTAERAKVDEYKWENVRYSDGTVSGRDKSVGSEYVKLGNISASTARTNKVDEPECGNLGGHSGDITARKDEVDESAYGTSDIIYSQNLIVRDSNLTSTVRSAPQTGLVNFKRFRKAHTQSGNSFSTLIPYSKYPYRESDNGEATDYMQVERKRKQMEAIAEDLFNNEKGKKRGKAGAILGFMTRG